MGDGSNDREEQDGNRYEQAIRGFDDAIRFRRILEGLVHGILTGDHSVQQAPISFRCFCIGSVNVGRNGRTEDVIIADSRCPKPSTELCVADICSPCLVPRGTGPRLALLTMHVPV